jgi:hypothetical protein
MSRIAYVNGRYVDQRRAEVNIEDRGYQFGDGIYEVVHLHGARFIDEDHHWPGWSAPSPRSACRCPCRGRRSAMSWPRSPGAIG